MRTGRGALVFGALAVVYVAYGFVVGEADDAARVRTPEGPPT